MRIVLLILALSAGCTHNTESVPNTAVDARAAGPCRDDEALLNGTCAPRIPGDQRQVLPVQTR